MNARTTFPTAARIPLIDPRELTDVVFAVAAGEDQFPTITRYWNEPAFRAELDAETQANRDTANAHFDAHRDAALRKLGYI